MSSRQFLTRIIHRDVKTHYTISEVLECGHRYESLTLLSDPLVAKHRICEKCAQVAKKPSTSVLLEARGESKRLA
jgi:hypothetical protein